MKNAKLLNMVENPRAMVVFGEKRVIPDLFHCTHNETGAQCVTLGIFSLSRPTTEEDDWEKMTYLADACDVALVFKDRNGIRKMREWLDWVDEAFAEDERAAETKVPEAKE